MSEQLPITITELLSRARERWPDRPYLQVRIGDTLNSLSFREVAAESETVARVLVQHGAKRGDRIALLAENRPAWVFAYYGILLAGGVVVPVDSLMSPPEIVNVLRMAAARLFLTTDRFLTQLTAIEAFREVSAKCIILDRDLRPDADSAEGIEFPAPASDDVAVIIFTSGTTGYSKGVVLTHRNLCSDIQAIMGAGVLRPDDSFLLLLPLHHTYSSTVNMLGTLALGSRALFATSFKSRDIVDDIRIGRISMLVGVPQVFENLMIGIRRAVSDLSLGKRILFHTIYWLSDLLFRCGVNAGGALFRSLREKAGMGTLRHMVSGGAALPADINRFFVNLGFELLQGYGLTETSPVLSVNRPGAIRIGSVGTALPGIELRIDSPDRDGVGEICARGPVVMQGYYNNPEANADVLRDGSFYTGDAGYLDRDGYLFITGRIKNIIVTGAGKNIYPEPIEAELNASPYILESLVVGVKAKRGAGEELAAIIVPHKTYIETEHERGHHVNIESEVKSVVEAYNHSAPAHRRLRQWKIRDEEFDKTSTRKIRRYLYTKEF
jgi:long-chain acyl-CoA synthetase